MASPSRTSVCSSLSETESSTPHAALSRANRDFDLEPESFGPRRMPRSMLHSPLDYVPPAPPNLATLDLYNPFRSMWMLKRRNVAIEAAPALAAGPVTGQHAPLSVPGFNQLPDNAQVAIAMNLTRLNRLDNVYTVSRDLCALACTSKHVKVIAEEHLWPAVVASLEPGPEGIDLDEWLEHDRPFNPFEGQGLVDDGHLIYETPPEDDWRFMRPETLYERELPPDVASGLKTFEELDEVTFSSEHKQWVPGAVPSRVVNEMFRLGGRWIPQEAAEREFCLTAADLEGVGSCVEGGAVPVTYVRLRDVLIVAQDKYETIEKLEKALRNEGQQYRGG